MPRMSTTPEPTVPLVLATDPAGLDDIQDPPVPQALQEALDTERPIDAPTEEPPTEAADTRLLDLALFKMSEHAAYIMQCLDGGFSKAIDRLDVNKAALETLAQATREQQRITPYSGTVSALTPSGFPLSLQVQGRTREEFLDALAGLLGFLKEQGFQPLTLPQLV